MKKQQKKKFESVGEYFVGATDHPEYGKISKSYLVSVRDTRGGRKNRHVAFRRVELNHRGEEVVLPGWIPITALDPEAVFEALTLAKAENNQEEMTGRPRTSPRPSLRNTLSGVAEAQGVTLNFTTNPLREVVDELLSIRQEIIEQHRM